MADTVINPNLEVTKWIRDFNTEYVQENAFSRYQGSDSNSVIQMKSEFANGGPGVKVVFNLVNRLTNDATDGSTVLEGNEEELLTREHEVTAKVRRHAVVYTKENEDKSAINMLSASRAALQTWADEDTRDRIIRAGHTIDGVTYASASEAQKDAWLANNSDRVLFGAAKSNNAANDHSAALAQVDNTADKLTTGALSLMKRMALEANPKVKPIRVGSMNRRFYVAYVHPRIMRDLKTDTTLTNAQRDVGLRMQNVKLFEGGDVEWDGIIVHEVDDMPIISNGTIDCAPVYFCGAQAFGMGFRSRWTPIKNTTDYGERVGYGIRSMYEVDKLRFGTGALGSTNTRDHGVLTGYFAAVADS